MNNLATSTVTLRHARETDAVMLCAAERDIARTPGRLVSLPEELIESNFARKIAELQTTGMYLVAERDGVIVGHAMLDTVAPLRRLAHVRTLTIVVHAANAGQGIGTALLRALLDAAAHNGIERIELRVRATNAAAIALYRKCGFTDECSSLRRIKLEDGSYLADNSMVWFAPGVQP